MNQRLNTLCAFLPALAAVCEHHLAASQPTQTQAEAPALDQYLEEFGKAQLAQRECEVVQMVLKRHSSQSIGLNFGISITTVKTHRKSIFAKLGIASQQELSTKFIQFLPSLA